MNNARQNTDNAIDAFKKLADGFATPAQWLFLRMIEALRDEVRDETRDKAEADVDELIRADYARILEKIDEGLLYGEYVATENHATLVVSAYYAGMQDGLKKGLRK